MSALEWLGAEYTFTQLAGESKTFDWLFERDGEPLSVSDVLFDGIVRSKGGESQTVVVQHVSGESNMLHVVFPSLDVGTYEYEVRYTTSTGVAGRLVFGRIGVMSTALVLGELESVENDSARMAINIPSEAGGQVLLEWRSGVGTVAAVQQALEAAKKLDGVDETLDRLAAQVEEFRVFTVRWHADIASILVMNPVTGTIWVDGHDTGQPYRGQDGKAPRVNVYGFWETFDGNQWNVLPYRAEGRDGVDGAALRRVLLASAELLPDESVPEEEKRGVMYYVPRGSSYDAYVWLEGAGWVNVGETIYPATETSLGLVKAGTGQELNEGAPVGLNSAKQMYVGPASSTTYGVFKASSPEVSDSGGRLHMSTSGSLLSDLASVRYAGSVKLSTATVLDQGGIIGVNADGQLVVRMASFTHPGAVLPGSSYEQLTRRPYQMAVGVDKQGRLANCLVGNGAFQHKLKADWLDLKNQGLIQWLNTDDLKVDGAHYAGLFTSNQFDQSELNGLELKKATEQLVAGVRLATGPDDTADDYAVLSAKRANDAFERKGAGYTKEEADEKFMRSDGNAYSVKVCKVGESLPPASQQEKGMIYLAL